MKCSCNVCSVHIEFDDSMVGQRVACPECGSETLLYAPPPPVPPAIPGGLKPPALSFHPSKPKPRKLTAIFVLVILAFGSLMAIQITTFYATEGQDKPVMDGVKKTERASRGGAQYHQILDAIKLGQFEKAADTADWMFLNMPNNYWTERLKDLKAEVFRIDPNFVTSYSYRDCMAIGIFMEERESAERKRKKELDDERQREKAIEEAIKAKNVESIMTFVRASDFKGACSIAEGIVRAFPDSEESSLITKALGSISRIHVDPIGGDWLLGSVYQTLHIYKKTVETFTESEDDKTKAKLLKIYGEELLTRPDYSLKGISNFADRMSAAGMRLPG